MIYHIADKREWENSLSEKEYEPASLHSEGFIHCSPLEKLEESANSFFKGKMDLVVLCIDEDKVVPEVVREDLYKTNFNFPHIYGKLNIDAVTRIIEIECDDEGLFNFRDHIF